MSEREPEISASTTDTPASTTDTSASTAEFRRFAAASAETAPPWSMRAPGKRVALLAIAVIAAAVILGIAAIIVVNM
jgi:hypothetical protein